MGHIFWILSFVLVCTGWRVPCFYLYKLTVQNFYVPTPLWKFYQNPPHMAKTVNTVEPNLWVFQKYIMLFISAVAYAEISIRFLLSIAGALKRGGCIRRLGFEPQGFFHSSGHSIRRYHSSLMRETYRSCSNTANPLFFSWQNTHRPDK